MILKINYCENNPNKYDRKKTDNNKMLKLNLNE